MRIDHLIVEKNKILQYKTTLLIVQTTSTITYAKKNYNTKKALI